MYYIIDILDGDHADNTRIYSIEEAIDLAKELIDIEKASYSGPNNWRGGCLSENNIKECLLHFNYEMKSIPPIYDSKGKKKNVLLKACYDLDGEYIEFEYNPLHNTTYKNATVKINTVKRCICGIEFLEDVIEIDDQAFEGELVNYKENGDDLIIYICQDWG